MARSSGADAVPSRRARGSRLVTVVVVVTVLACVDLVGGAILTGTNLLVPLDRGDVYRLERAQSRNAGLAPAVQDAPWHQRHIEELLAFQGRYVGVPYLQQGTYEFHSSTINTTDRERRSYRPPAAATGDPLRVAFFGGSVVFGIGQRDEHTIPSEFARIAEEHGVPVEVHNYGFPRWVIWQEHQYLERILAQGEDFDLIVFLDGFNEFYVQAEELSYDPTFHAADAMDALVREFRRERTTPPSAADGLRDLAEQYRRNSAFWRVVDRVRGRQVPVYDTSSVVHGSPEEQATAALGIYERAQRLVHDLADRDGTPVRFFWQPQAAGWPASVTERLPADVVDLSHTFDGREQELYFDVVHTNEEGARLLAEAMWDAVAADLAGGST